MWLAKTSFEACSTAGIARCLLVSAQIFENLVGRKYWNFVRTLSQTGAIILTKLQKLKREFDPGSESTLAARLTHASRTRKWSNP
jgi:hypothetical protein